MKKLNLGCGLQKLDGWINIDAVKECGPDVVHDLTDPLSYEDQSVDEVLARDLLEHFDKYMRYSVVFEWARVLKVGGRITVVVPDIKKILWRYFKLGFNNFVDTVFGENLWASEIYTGTFGLHKWGYSQETLKNFMKTFGIEQVSVKTAGLNIEFVGEKKEHIPEQAILDLKIYSHANACGNGKSLMPLSEVKKRISVFRKKH